MIHVSIVIPVFNAEKYLEDCINSVLGQSYQEFELVLVDDGSKDKSGSICDDYAKKDKRIQVYHKQNGGVTSARREGVIRARSEWIMFVDADDELEIDGIEKLAIIQEQDQELDIIEGAYTWFYPDGTRKFRCNMAQENGPVLFDSHAYSRSLYMMNGPARGPWAKLIRKQILLESGALDLPKKFTNREDAMMLTTAARNMRKAVLLPDSVYLYRQQFGETATSNKLSFTYWSDYLEYTETVVLKDLLPQWIDVWRSTIKDVFGIIVHSGCVGYGEMPFFFHQRVLPELTRQVKHLNRTDRIYVRALNMPTVLRVPICTLLHLFFVIKKSLLGRYLSYSSRK